MIEVTILVPLADNDGEHFSATHHRVFEAFVLDRFGGLSWLPKGSEGLWRDEGGITYRDATVAMVVAVEGMVKQADALREVIDFAKAHYRQLAIYTRYLGVAEIV
ncbi:hypothetical protein [Sandaracinus amylolyticus]|uniref:hypothetical protein n=1 Tax=Sandaracinus amylolyticus TaxID=927083 RepID=UPI001F32E2D7|nr:hypothetical protein [Sandaracinus amylolyticus]UJR81511.1 Hypothetical protein I5071_35710 [Sandaracinus amylolyticus]